MAAHYPDPDAAEILRKALVSMQFPDRIGIDSEVSEFGVTYKRITAKDDDANALASMAQSHLKREFDNGAQEIIWRKIPTINGFEEGRNHSKMLVLEYHTLPKEGVVSEAEANGVPNASNPPSPD